MQDALFFIALIPPTEIAEEVEAFKSYTATHFHSSRALRSPAHITIIPPFKWPLLELNEIKSSLKNFANNTKRFYLNLNNFDCFAPRVIFVDLEPSEALKEFQSALAKQLELKFSLDYNQQFGFHPHMTVAFKDLKKTLFPEAWAYFSTIDYQRSFAVEELSLLKHNNRRWEIESQFKLK